MTIDAEISLYPLRNVDLSTPIDLFLARLRESGATVEPGAMSSRVTGECAGLFRALADAFEQRAAVGDVVLVMKVSNACR